MEAQGKIVEALPNSMFAIELDNGGRVLGHLTGMMRSRTVRFLPGDRVTVELSPYDLQRGRIVFRER